MADRPPRILLADDEQAIQTLLSYPLQKDGYEVVRASDGREALARFAEQPFDLVVLDVMMPRLDGLEVCRRLRSRSSVPIIMLTAKAEEIDKVLGLELGADDYIVKPFSPREVVARIRAVLRRTQPSSPGAEPQIHLDEERFEVRVRGKSLALTPVEFRLLRKLVAQPGRVFSRAQLIDALYVDHRVVSDRTVDSHVKNLRRKLAECGADPVASVYGVGYRFEWPESAGG